MSERGFSVYDRSFPGLGWERDKSHEVKVYVLVDPRDNTVRYVGQSVEPLKRRGAHRGQKPSGNRLLEAWRAELRELGLKPLMAIVDSAAPAYAHGLEDRWITYYRRFGRLHNVLLSANLRADDVVTHDELDAALSKLKRAKRSHHKSKLGELERFLKKTQNVTRIRARAH